MTTEVQAPAAPDEMDFDAAFAEAAAAAEKGIALEPAMPPADPPAGDPPADPPATPPETPPADPPADPPVDPETPPVTPPAPAPAAPAAAPTPPADPEPPQETESEKAAREAIEASIKPYEPTPEEKAFEEKMKTDFPGEYATMMAKFKAQKQSFNAKVYQAVQEVLKVVTPRLASVEATTTDTVRRDHFTAVRAAHPDYDAVVAKVPDWIKAQPAYVQPALQRVYNEGNTQDVIAMIADYKKATGAPAPAAPPPAAPAAKPKPAGVDDLAPVSSRRVVTSPKGTPDPNDFEGAWKEAVASLG
jgi:hypothetical protein